VSSLSARCPASSAAHQSDAVTLDVEGGGRRVSPITTGPSSPITTGPSSPILTELRSPLRLDYANSMLTGLSVYLVKRQYSR